MSTNADANSVFIQEGAWVLEAMKSVFWYLGEFFPDEQEVILNVVIRMDDLMVMMTSGDNVSIYNATNTIFTLGHIQPPAWVLAGEPFSNEHRNDTHRFIETVCAVLEMQAFRRL